MKLRKRVEKKSKGSLALDFLENLRHHAWEDP
jgi:hypothetical protein